MHGGRVDTAVNKKTMHLAKGATQGTRPSQAGKESKRFQKAGAKIVTQPDGAYLTSVASEEREDCDSEGSEEHFRSSMLETPTPAIGSQGTTYLALGKLSQMRQKKKYVKWRVWVAKRILLDLRRQSSVNEK